MQGKEHGLPVKERVLVFKSPCLGKLQNLFQNVVVDLGLLDKVSKVNLIEEMLSKF